MSVNKTSYGTTIGDAQLKSQFDEDFELPEVSLDHFDLTDGCTHSCTCSCTCGLNPL